MTSNVVGGERAYRSFASKHVWSFDAGYARIRRHRRAGRWRVEVGSTTGSTEAKARPFDVVVCWRLDRLGRNLKHLITLLDDLQTLAVSFVSLAERIDATTPAGKLQMHILGAIAEFERERIRERVLAGLQRARAQGKRLGRPRARIPIEPLKQVHGLSNDRAAAILGVSRSTLKRWRRRVDGQRA